MFSIYGIVISILLVFFNISRICCNLVFFVFGAIDASVYMLLFVLIKIVVSIVALIKGICFVRIYEFL